MIMKLSDLLQKNAMFHVEHFIFWRNVQWGEELSCRRRFVERGPNAQTSNPRRTKVEGGGEKAGSNQKMFHVEHVYVSFGRRESFSISASN